MFLTKYIFNLRERSIIDEEKPFLSHLEDLRRTLIKMVITLVLAMLVCFSFAPTLLKFLSQPVSEVWTGYEKTHLPSSVRAEDWIRAKKLVEAAPGLPPKAYDALVSRESKEMKELTETVALLRAKRSLPEKEQESFLKEAASSESIVVKVNELEKTDALLQAGEGSSGVKMMSALQPTESFNLSLKIALFAGIVISFPLLSLFALEFIFPGLKDNERKMLMKAMMIGVGLFLTGASFAYFVALPGVLDFFFSYSMNMGISNDWRIGFYLSFVIQFVLLFGLAFELPVVVMPFVKLGVLTYDMMRSTRRYAIIVIFVASSFLTPADIMSLLLMAVPMCLLYEICIFLAKREHKRQLKAEAEEEQRVREWEENESPYTYVNTDSPEPEPEDHSEAEDNVQTELK